MVLANGDMLKFLLLLFGVTRPCLGDLLLPHIMRTAATAPPPEEARPYQFILLITHCAHYDECNGMIKPFSCTL